MTMPELERLREKALADPSEEAPFLRGLLTTTLYAHLPLWDDSERMRLVMFTRPDGLTVIPVFTDLPKAKLAAGGNVRVASVPGRELFEATRGATVMLDPNDIGMTLYPEEIAALLDEGRIPRAPAAFDGPDLELQPPHAQRDAWLLDLLDGALAGVESVRRVHLAVARPVGADGPPDRFLVIVATPLASVERAARAIAVALESAPRPPWLPIDLASYEPDDPLPDHLVKGLQMAWTHELGRAPG